MRRAPASVVRLKDVNKYSRVAAVGTVIRKEDNEITLDDGTGQVIVFLNDDVEYRVKDVVRVFGRVYGNTIEAEFLVDMNDLNTDLYQKSIDIIHKYHEL